MVNEEEVKSMTKELASLNESIKEMEAKRKQLRADLLDGLRQMGLKTYSTKSKSATVVSKTRYVVRKDVDTTTLVASFPEVAVIEPVVRLSKTAEINALVEERPEAWSEKLREFIDVVVTDTVMVTNKKAIDVPDDSPPEVTQHKRREHLPAERYKPKPKPPEQKPKKKRKKTTMDDMMEDCVWE